jgi:hypothetical protein
VMRTGGWGTYKDIPAKSFPFVRRDFMVEFGRWVQVERFRSSLPAGENYALIEGASQLALEDNTSHRLDGFLARILESDVR